MWNERFGAPLRGPEGSQSPGTAREAVAGRRARVALCGGDPSGGPAGPAGGGLCSSGAAGPAGRWTLGPCFAVLRRARYHAPPTPTRRVRAPSSLLPVHREDQCSPALGEPTGDSRADRQGSGSVRRSSGGALTSGDGLGGCRRGGRGGPGRGGRPVSMARLDATGSREYGAAGPPTRGTGDNGAMSGGVGGRKCPRGRRTREHLIPRSAGSDPMARAGRVWGSWLCAAAGWGCAGSLPGPPENPRDLRIARQGPAPPVPACPKNLSLAHASAPE
jgi:hypothetical protein